MGIDLVQVAKAGHQVQGTLLADALDAWNIVRRIAHDRLKVDKLFRPDRIPVPDRSGCIDLDLGFTGGCDRMPDRDLVIDQLETILVTGQDCDLPALGRCLAGQGA